MTDIARSQDALANDPAALRRRARRRLVGAVALALTAVVAVPLLFDPNPKPLGSDVDIRIPSQESPFEPAPAGSGTTSGGATIPAPKAGEEMDAPAPMAVPAEPTPISPPPKAVVPELPREAKLPPPKPTQAPLKADAAFASKGYYLQLGAFSNRANAKALQHKVEAAGFGVGMTDSNSQYRVRVGPIEDRKQALETLAKLRAKGFSPVIIGP